MRTIAITADRLGIRWGVLIYLALAAYFLIMKAAGLIYVTELRVFNGVFMFYGIYRAVRFSYLHTGELNYFRALASGLWTAFVASVLFAASGAFYLALINPGFVNELQSNEPLGAFMTVYSAPLKVFIEGSASGFLFTYASLQWLRKEP